MCGFVVAFVYFYVYAVNYIRGVRAEDVLQDPVKNVQDFHERLARQLRHPANRNHKKDHTLPLPVARQRQASSQRRVDNQDLRQLQQPIHPR